MNTLYIQNEIILDFAEAANHYFMDQHRDGLKLLMDNVVERCKREKRLIEINLTIKVREGDINE